jgi:hypothetical protein
METLMKRSFFVLMAVLGMTTLRAQSVDGIVGKYIDAIGGKAALAGVNSLVITSTISVNGMDAPSTTYILAGKGFRSEMDFNGTKMIQAVSPAGGWAISPITGSTSAQAIPADQAKMSQSNYVIGGALTNYASQGNKVELIGKDTADYKLKMTIPSGDVTYYINQKTYLIDKEVINSNIGAQAGTTTITFSDYRKVDGGGGYVMPYTQSLDLPNVSLVITNQKITVNQTIDPTIFNMPK